MKPRVLLTHPLLPEAMDYLASQVDLELATEEMILPREEPPGQDSGQAGTALFPD